MKKKASYILLLLILPSCFLWSQQIQPIYSYRIIYKFEYQQDSTNKNSLKSEQMLLLANKDNSYFISWNQYIFDSLSFISNEKTGDRFAGISHPLQYSTGLDFKILKSKDSIQFWKPFGGRKMLMYSELRNNLKWSIESDAQMIAGISCQRAITEYAGRSWTAWFAASIPLPEGPYKFCDLPGLIVKISDRHNYFNFILESFEQTQVTPLTLVTNMPIQIMKRSEFIKYSEYYRNNRYEIDQAEGTTFTSGGEFIRKRLQELAKKQNNQIERY